MADPTPYHSIPERDRGRAAAAPHQIPARGWKDVLLRLKREIARDRISMVAGSVAFSSVLALFPGLIAIVSIYGLVADPADVERQVASFSGILPGDVRTTVDEQLQAIVSASQGALSAGLVISILGALWAASGGVASLITAVNIAYGEDETRGFVKVRGLSLAFTLGAILMLAVSVFLVGVVPALLDTVGLGDAAQRAIDVGRWPALALLAILALSMLYRYAPNRTEARWTWVTWGSVIATAIWLGASALFSVYVASFGTYNETYGAIGGVIVLLLWLYITALAILLGAEINAELEHQTARDSTVGEPEPMGQRGATMADTLGPSYP